MTKDIAYYLLILGLSSDFDENELKNAYKREAKKWHPDLNKNDANAEERLKLINEAKEVLSDYKKQEFSKVKNKSVNNKNKKSTKRNSDNFSSQNKTSSKEKTKEEVKFTWKDIRLLISIPLFFMSYIFVLQFVGNNESLKTRNNKNIPSKEAISVEEKKKKPLENKNPEDEVVYETPELAWNECRSWMKEGGGFYIREGSGYEMVTRWLPRRFCFYDEDKMEMVGQELTQIKEGDKFLDEDFPDIGKGIATPVTQKTYKYQKPIP